MTTDTIQHTPAGDWCIVGPFVQNGRGDVLATTYQDFTNADGGFDRLPELARANAAFIVLACNAHDGLLAALEALTAIGTTADGGIIVGPQGWELAQAAIRQARGA